MLALIQNIQAWFMLKTAGLIKNEEGAETLEYIVIASVIIIIGAAAYLTGIGQVFPAAFNALVNLINNPTGAG